MALLPLGSISSSPESSGTWLKRVSENLRQVLHSSGIAPTSANGAPLHFETIDLSARHGKAQSFSAGIHAVLVAGLLFALAYAPAHSRLRHTLPPGTGPTLLPYPPSHLFAADPSLGHGAGGENDPRPTRSGELAPRSSMPLAPPRLNRNENVLLPAPPAVLDVNAPASVPTVTNLGLPWMKSDTDSAGPGGRHGFGAGTNGSTMGDGSRDGAGQADDDSAYANAVSPVTCVYCPDPPYSEEARKAKLQGKLLLRVLVGPDGKAQKIQILEHLGLGLDERAEETLRTWRFSPARDAAKHPIAAWVTIETHFQLF